jgi:hypothetical protein
LTGITAIAGDRYGNLYIAIGSAGGGVVRKVDSHGYITTVPTQGITLINPVGVAVDAAGLIFISDAGNNDLVRVDLSGNASVVAGQPGMVGSGCGTPNVWSSKTSLGPVGPVVTDGSGNVYLLSTTSANSYLCNVGFALQASNHSIGFTDTTPGTTSTSAVNPAVYNNGNVDTTLSASGFVLSGSSAFAQNAGNTPSGKTTCGNGTSLPVGGSCYVSLQFTAPAVQKAAYTGTVTLTDGAYNSSQAISLSGYSIGGENKLGFPNAPYSVNLGGGLPTVTVQVQDSNGNLVPTASDLITLTLTYPDSTTQTYPARYATQNNTSGGTATGQVGFNLGSVFQFPGLYTLQATATGLTPASTSFTINPPASGTYFVVSASPSTITAGGTTTITVTAMSGGATATGYTGTVRFACPCWANFLPTTRSPRATPVSTPLQA